MSNFSTTLYLIILMAKVLMSISKKDQNNALNKHIDNVRNKVVDFCNFNSDEVYMLDCEDIRSRDWVIERYLKDNSMNEKKAVKKILDNLKFYKTEELQELTDDYFPAEFYATGYVVRQAKSKKSEAVYGFCQRCYKPFGKISEDMYQLGRKYLLYIMYKNRMELDYSSRLNYISLTGINLENLDIRFLMNIIENVNTKQPKMPGILFALDLPYILGKTWNTIVNLFAPDIKNSLQVISINEFEKWVSLDDLPTYVGGRFKNWNRIPAGVQAGKCLEHLSHIPKEEWSLFRDQNIKCIMEGMKDAGVSSVDEFLGHCHEQIKKPSIKIGRNAKE